MKEFCSIRKNKSEKWDTERTDYSSLFLEKEKKKNVQWGERT
jgi:hypothetical protein